MNYYGELYFEDDEPIYVESLILRSDKEISFSIIASWDGAKWSRAGIAYAQGNSYISNAAPSSHIGTGELGPDCTIKFSKMEIESEFLTVEGSWSERGDVFTFEGDLEVHK